MSLAPQPRLLALLGFGAALLLLISVVSWTWPAAVIYHVLVLAYAIFEARRLPGAARVRVARSVPRPLSLGAVQEVRLDLLIPGGASLWAEVADGAPLSLRARPRVVEGVVGEDSRLTLAYEVRPEQRGSFVFEFVDLRYGRRGGAWFRHVRLPHEERAAVYPDILAVRGYELRLRRGMRPLAGLRRTRPPGAATAFAGLRDYLPGDEMRRVNWSATARRDHPITTVSEAEKGQQVVLAIDCARLMTAPAGVLTKLDHAVNAALLLAWVAVENGDRVGLVTFTDGVRAFLQPRRGGAQVNRINQALFDIRAEYTEPDFGEALGQLAARLSRRSLVIILTDVLDPEASSELVASALRLSRRHLVLVVALADPEVLSARDRPVDSTERVYEWAAAEELLAARRRSFELLRQGGVPGLDVKAGELSAALVERYLDLKERALL